MGLGSTAKTIQTLAERAEQLYAQLMDVRERLARIEDDIDTTSNRVVDMEREQEEQRVILEALAEEEGLDVDMLIAESTIVDAEAPGEPTSKADATERGTDAADSDADVTLDGDVDAQVDASVDDDVNTSVDGDAAEDADDTSPATNE